MPVSWSYPRPLAPYFLWKRPFTSFFCFCVFRVLFRVCSFWDRFQFRFRALGPLGSRAFGHLGLLAPGPLGTWAFGYLDIFVLILSRFRPDFIPISSWFRPDFVPISSQFRPDFVSILSWFRPDFVPISSRFRPDFVPILSRFLPNPRGWFYQIQKVGFTQSKRLVLPNPKGWFYPIQKVGFT